MAHAIKINKDKNSIKNLAKSYMLFYIKLCRKSGIEE